MVRLTKKAHGVNNFKFGWDDVVCVCRDIASGAQLAAPPAPAKAAQSAAARAPQPARALPQRAAVTAHTGGMHGSTNPQASSRGQEKRCDLCAKLGLGGDAHHRD